MDWPLASHYTAILQNPGVAFVNPELRERQIRRNAHNQPHGVSGQFAIVFEGILPDGSSRAIRAFTSSRAERTERYQLISEYLSQQPHLSSLVEFLYFERGIRAVTSSGRARLYPLITMQWVAGDTLYDWVQDRCRAGEQDRLRSVAELWLQVVEHLEDSQIVHGDLQHGNVMVTATDELKLVDYDGLCVPALVGRRNLETGVPPYQHPQRDEHTRLGLSLDRFSALFIYVALRALAAAPTLWTEFVEVRSYDKLLFSEFDLAHSTRSELCQALRTSPDAEVPRLSDILIDAYQGSMDTVPRLRDALSLVGRTPPPDPVPLPTDDELTAPPAMAPEMSAPPDPTVFVPEPSNEEAAAPPLEALQEAPPGASDEPAAEPAPAYTPVTAESPGLAQTSPGPTTPTPSVADTERRQEPTPGVAAMLGALRDRDKEQFCDLLDTRLVRAHVQQFTPYRQLLLDWTQDRFRTPEQIGLRKSRGRESLTPSPGKTATNQARWMWPQARISQICLVGLSRAAVTDDDAPESLDLEVTRTVTREHYESGRGMILHADRTTMGCHVIVWAIIDLGFESLYSEPLNLGRLKSGSTGPQAKSRRW